MRSTTTTAAPSPPSGGRCARRHRRRPDRPGHRGDPRRGRTQRTGRDALRADPGTAPHGPHRGRRRADASALTRACDGYGWGASEHAPTSVTTGDADQRRFDSRRRLRWRRVLVPGVLDAGVTALRGHRTRITGAQQRAGRQRCASWVPHRGIARHSPLATDARRIRPPGRLSFRHPTPELGLALGGPTLRPPPNTPT